MRYLSLFSGIEAATVAWSPLGWKAVAFAEIESAPAAVLAHRYPEVPNLGDVTAITDEQIAALGPIDVVVGGSPCQDLSIAGKGAGLCGARSGLFHEQVRIFHAARRLCGARWLLWENVPGAFSNRAGRDFAVVVNTLAGCQLPVPAGGWGSEGVALGEHGLLEWAVLDAQWFGVAQRRRRVFAVLDTGNWSGRAPVLLEPDGLRGDSAPRREAGPGIAGALTGGVGSRGGIRAGADEAAAGHLVPDIVGQAISSKWSKGSSGPAGDEHHNLIACFDELASLSESARPPAIAYSLRSDAGRDGVAKTPSPDAEGRVRLRDPGFNIYEEVAPTLDATGPHSVGCWPPETADPISASEANTYTHEGKNNFRLHNVVPGGMRVRRLTPRECERLQGFPDDWTLVPHRGKLAADGPRYRMIGNSMAVPVMAWVGRRIAAVSGRE